MDEVAPSHFELVWYRESEVFRGDGVEVEGDDWGWVGYNRFNVYCVDERLGHCRLFERRIIEAPYVVPD